MANNNPKILDRLTPEFQGAIWVGNGPLDTNLPGFPELNYLFDGLISQSIAEYSLSERKKSLSFFTKNFGENFFLHYYVEISKFPVSILDNKLSHRNKVLIINANAKTKIATEVFEKYFPEITFEIIDLA